MEEENTDGILFSENGKHDAPALIWDDAAAFLAVAREGTLSRAAARLRIGMATLSRRIDRLEAALGLPLFVRRQTGYTLTEEGAALVEKAETLEAAALAFSSSARSHAQISGRVRLATAENLATSLIAPALPEFQARYPDVTVEIATDVNTVNLHRRDADLAIRMIRPDRGHVSVQRLGVLGFGLYGSDAYLARRAEAPDAGRYETDAFIGWTEEYGRLPAAQWIERVLRGRRPVAATTSLAAQISAAKAGLGLAVLPHFLAARDGLRCVDAGLGVDQSIYLVIQSDLAQSRRVRALADFLTDLVRRHRAELRGPARASA